MLDSLAPLSSHRFSQACLHLLAAILEVVSCLSLRDFSKSGGIQCAMLRYPVHGLWQSEVTSHRHLPALTAAGVLHPHLQNPHRFSPQETAVNLVSWPWGMRTWAKVCDNRIAEVNNTNNKNAFQRLHALQSCFIYVLSRLGTSYGNYWKLKLVLRNIWYF